VQEVGRERVARDANMQRRGVFRARGVRSDRSRWAHGLRGIRMKASFHAQAGVVVEP